MKIPPESAAHAVHKFALMAFFPGDPDTRAALIYVLMELVDTQEHLDWLVARALKLYTRWPGVGELRALYCSRYKPKDGEETYSEIFPCGFPSESHSDDAQPSALPKGRQVSADADLDREVRSAAGAKRMPEV